MIIAHWENNLGEPCSSIVYAEFRAPIPRKDEIGRFVVVLSLRSQELIVMPDSEIIRYTQ